MVVASVFGVSPVAPHGPVRASVEIPTVLSVNLGGYAAEAGAPPERPRFRALHGLLTGRELEKAVNLASVDDPDALRWYARFAADRAR
ncbi:hypothetical protein [Amycolatopsis sp. NPDC004378]